MFEANIGVIALNVLVVAEEFGDWDDSRRRIDLLGVDKVGTNLVVIELKRTEDGRHMELQAIRCTRIMISSTTFAKLTVLCRLFGCQPDRFGCAEQLARVFRLGGS